jgi:chemotaxis protein MotB
MAEDNQGQRKEEPIIIKKKKGHCGHGHHGGAWKVAYADFVTAMMAFFIVMWILAASAETKDAVSSYFNDPGAFDFISGAPLVVDLNLKPQNKGPGGGDEGSEENDGTEPFKISFDDEMTDSIVSRLYQKAAQDSAVAADIVKEISEEITKELGVMIQQKPDLQELLESLKIEMSEEGLRIELIERTESLFFEVGSSNLLPEAKEILAKLAAEIGKLPNNVEIEGHTDSRGYSDGAAFTNWELSSARANSARRVLEQSGLWEGQVPKVTGYADRKLRNPENPFDVSNRRVSIVIRHLKAKDFVPSEKGNQ